METSERTLKCNLMLTFLAAGALEVDLEWGRMAAAAALDARALSLAAGPRWSLAALAPRTPQPRRGLSLQARPRTLSNTWRLYVSRHLQVLVPGVSPRPRHMAQPRPRVSAA